MAFVLGYGAMVPFMSTSILAGAVAVALHGADLAFYVGFIVTGALYYCVCHRGWRACAGDVAKRVLAGSRLRLMPGNALHLVRRRSPHLHDVPAIDRRAGFPDRLV